MASDGEDMGSSPERDNHAPDLDSDQDDVDMAESFLSKDGVKLEGSSSYEGTPNGKSKSSKDPSRPRRKKARRACHACQRAHLTCGDERPCQRCIKRGLQDQCQDGFRKKAKYLHDAPPEALIPPNLGGTFNFSDPKQAVAAAVATTPRTPMAQQQNSYFPTSQNAIDIYSQNPAQSPMAALLAATSATYGNVNTPISPFNVSGSQPGHVTTPTIPQQQSQTQQTPTHHQHIPFDPSDPAIFNFNIDGLNFGNRYGALEFGMLQTMSNGMNDSHGDVVTPLNSHVPSAYSLNFSSPVGMFDQNALLGMNYSVPGPGHRHPPSNPDTKTPHNTPNMKSADMPESSGNNAPYAYAIGAPQRPNSLASASPVSLSQDTPVMNEGNNSPALFASSGVGGENVGFAVDNSEHHQLPGPLHPHRLHHQHHHHHQPVRHPNSNVSNDSMPSISGRTAHPHSPANPRKRAHNSDNVYGRVQKPYSYHAGWHRLFTYIKNHFSKENVQRIAQYVSVIRPPLTAFAQSLSVHDLVFMETTVQRQLFEYRDFIKATGTPTIVTRRDGTILAVSEEFCKMTRWSEGVVLGKEKNWNVNRGQGSLQAVREREKNGGGMDSDEEHAGRGGDGQGVLISEIFDQQTVVDFFNDYARLAFGDPMGRAVRRGKLLRYATKEEALASGQSPRDSTGNDAYHEGNGTAEGKSKGSLSSKVGDSKNGTNSKSLGIKNEDQDREDSGIAGESAFLRLGEKEGVVDCMYCWWMRRDLFEVPALIVINFLPVIPSQT